VSPDVLEQEVDDWAQEILSKSPTAITLAKKMHNVYYDMLTPSVEAGVELLTFFWGTDEAREGIAKTRLILRSPIFTLHSTTPVLHHSGS